MSKISIEEVEAVLHERKLDKSLVNDVIRQLNEVVEEEKAAKVSDPKQKNEYLIILHDPNNEIAGKEFSGWVVQNKSGDDQGLVLSHVRSASVDNNEAQKRKKRPITNFIEAFSSIKRKFLKDRNILIKTKNAVRVLITDGKF